MGPILSALVALQAVENDLTHVRRRLNSKRNAVRVVENKIKQLENEKKALSERLKLQQAKSDEMELERATHEQEVEKLRGDLNKAKTNKEYASILTHINSIKADNSKLEDEVLKTMETLDASRKEVERIDNMIEIEQKRLDQASEANSAEIDKLNGMLEKLQGRRDEAASQVSPDVLAVFDRIAEKMDGEGLAQIEVAGKTDFVCGGCYMSLSAEHYSSLMSKDEIRHCDSCGRILYILEDAAAN